VAEFRVDDTGKNGSRAAKRDKMEIVSAIIAITQQPSTSTQLMGNANMSHSRLKEYLGLMIGSGLIKQLDMAKGARKRTVVYQATERGNKFLELFCENLILLHGELFLESNSDLADAYLLQHCRKSKLP